MSIPTPQLKALQAIAIFEAAKGTLVVLLMMGLIGLLHQDIRQVVHNIIGHYGLDESKHLPILLEHSADVFYDSNKLQWFALAVAYVGMRYSEAYGLWHKKVWGEWLTAFSGGIYLPFEALHMLHSPSWSSVLVFVGNALMVAYLAWRLWQTKQANQNAPD